MVYISDGKVVDNSPWSVRRLVGLLWGIIAFIIYFFKSLVGLQTTTDRDGRGGYNGGGSGGSGRGPGDGPGGGSKRIGRITRTDECSMPGGGCCG